MIKCKNLNGPIFGSCCIYVYIFFFFFLKKNSVLVSVPPVYYFLILKTAFRCSDIKIKNERKSKGKLTKAEVLTGLG